MNDAKTADENSFSSGPLEITWGNTVEDAREVLGKLIAEKASRQADKRELTAQLTEIRAEYRERVAHRIPIRGGRGFFGSLLRTSRAAHRAGNSDRLRPLERRKQEIEEAIVGIDHAAAHLKAWITERGGRVAAPRAANPTPDTKDDPLATLGRLADLRDRGAITAEEYAAKKADLLSRL